ncbi:MAG: bifunctional DNA primase/polymerase [Chloroflexi bacterium]|nr:bifunctional DNA primase/polymerase [Chloroflexota bacterium]
MEVASLVNPTPMPAGGQSAVSFDAALDLLALGYSLIPLYGVRDGRCTCGAADCRSAGKHPFTPFVPNGVKDATDDPEKIGSWLRQHPHANIGGYRPGTFRLDIDDAEVFAQLQDQLGKLPPTVSMKTGSGGLHLEFKIPAGIALTQGTPWSGAIDIRVAGLGYAVLPPSVTSGAYSWLVDGDPHEIQPAELPQAWLRAILDHQAGRHGTNGAALAGVGGLLFPANASAPHEQLAALLANDDKFARTWRRERTDLPTQSEYDAAIVALTSAVGWTRQESWAAVTQHRREHGEDVAKALRPDYARRTLAAVWREPSTTAPAPDSGENGSAPTAPSAWFHRTDAGNAELFAQLYGNRVRYDHRRGLYYVYGEHSWIPERETEGELGRLAKNVARERLRHAAAIADEKERKAEAAWALASESQRAIGATLALARNEPPISTGGEWDADPLLLGVQNGVVDLRTGTLRAGRTDDKITMRVAAPFDPNARCPRFSVFLSEIFEGDVDLIQYEWRAFGYTLSGLNVEHVCFLCVGDGANGKGKLLNTLRQLLGDYAANAPFSTFEANSRLTANTNDLAALAGKRLVTASETSDEIRLNEARVKAITGGDPVTARFLNREFFTYNPSFKLWLATNSKPRVRDDSYGFWRRVHLVPFGVTFVDPASPAHKAGECDSHRHADLGLEDKLVAELPGILAGAVRGFLDYKRVGLRPPPAVLNASEAYRREEDGLEEFLAACCVLGPNLTVSAAALHAAYQTWARQAQIRERDRLSRDRFGRRVGKRGFEHIGSRIRSYRGLALANAHQPHMEEEK